VFWLARPAVLRQRYLCAALVGALVALRCPPALGQDRSPFVGALAGFSVLSADGQSVTSGPDAVISLYAPQTGPALNAFGGVHLAPYFSVQASWMWNANDLTLTSSAFSPTGGRFYEQRRKSGQNAVVFDALVYFRRLGSSIRPYLGTGLALVHVSSTAVMDRAVHGLTPPGDINATRAGLRSHVGIDVKLTGDLAVRYSFSETISGNPFSAALTPPARRRLANFQNLFGVVRRF